MNREIRFFGDSVFKGVIYDQNTNRYHLCKDQLLIPNLEVKNCCRMGATSRHGLEIVKRNLETVNENTLAVLEYGGNDCNYDWKSISENPYQNATCAVMPDEYRENMTIMAKMLREKGATVCFSTLAPIEENKFFSFLSRGLSPENILKWLKSVRALYDWQAHYSKMAQEVAKETGSLLLDLRTDLGPCPPSRFCADGIHPTEEGHQIIHRTVEQEIGLIL